MPIDDLELTDEEIELLKADGVIPPDWEPGMELGALDDAREMPGEIPEEEFEPLGAPQGEMPELEYETMDPEASMVAGEVPAVEPGTEVQGGIDLLASYEREAPAVQDPAIKRFSDIALRWLPTDDSELQKARAEAQRSANQLAQLRIAAERAAQAYPWDVFTEAMWTPKPSFGFTASMAGAMKAVRAERENREKVARELGIKEAEMLSRQATAREASEINRVRAGADLAQTSARMRQLSMAADRAIKSGGTFCKKMADLGVDCNTPEGQKAARRMYILENAKNDQITIQTLLQNPDMDPLDPESGFGSAVAAGHVAKGQAKEAEAQRKLKRQEEKDARLIEESKLRTQKLRQEIENKQRAGKPLNSQQIKQLTGLAEIADATDRFINTFDDDYAGYKSEFVGDAVNWSKRTFGDESNQGAWWQDYELHQSQIRNNLFGSALTPGEQAAWMKSAIHPGMDPGEVRKNLARRNEIETTAIARLMRGLEAGGHGREQIEEFAGRPIPPKEAAQAPGMEVKVPHPKTGRVGIFDAKTKKFKRWE